MKVKVVPTGAEGAVEPLEDPKFFWRLEVPQ